LYQSEAQLKAELQLVPKHAGAQAMLQEVRRRISAPPPDRNPVLLNNQAWHFLELGDARAEDFARRAYELAPQNPQIIDTYGWVLLRAKKDVQRALPLLGEAAKAAPNDANIQYHHASALAAAGKSTEARSLLQSVLAGGSAFASRKEAEGLLETLAAQRP
jgi:predicted Zn-dependent protease